MTFCLLSQDSKATVLLPKAGEDDKLLQENSEDNDILAQDGEDNWLLSQHDDDHDDRMVLMHFGDDNVLTSDDSSESIVSSLCFPSKNSDGNYDSEQNDDDNVVLRHGVGTNELMSDGSTESIVPSLRFTSSSENSDENYDSESGSSDDECTSQSPGDGVDFLHMLLGAEHRAPGQVDIIQKLNQLLKIYCLYC